MRVEPVVMPHDGAVSWTLLDEGLSVVEPVEAFLAHLMAVERSPNTVRAYAHDLRDYFAFLALRELDWASVRLEDLGAFVAWLRLAGGREIALGDLAADGVLGGVNGLIVGNYLTTLGRAPEVDRALLAGLGVPVRALQDLL